ncbi:membrane protein of unknown function [Nitrosotalea devaniterrae]|uniref:Uncharacterized protein n=1 Tax=Nitrosotalea devaniterrae TaxID=1078905 RepID=A0A128A260_9ARCH|nr:membrane protein of unknown function [Candidatus Nitrosotalea devanaterra]
MKTLQLLVIVILIISCIILLNSTIGFGLSEKYFEDQRNGLTCTKPGSSCPLPDFEDPMFYGIAGLGIFASGAILSTFKAKYVLSRLILGITLLISGIPALIIGLLAYADDYDHYVTMMKKCSLTPCMAPNIFFNIQFVEFYVIYGAVLSTLGGILFVMYLGRKFKK